MNLVRVAVVVLSPLVVAGFCYAAGSLVGCVLWDAGGSAPAPQHDQYVPSGDTAPLFLRRLDAGAAAADRASDDVAAAQGVVDAVTDAGHGAP